MSIVFDSGALLAYLGGETGSDLVGGLLEDADVSKLAHAANMCEVFYKFALSYGDAAAHAAIRELQLLGLSIRDDMDNEFWLDMASLIAQCRREKRPLALGDAFGVALARREDADFVTTDRGELEAVRASGAARIVFIR